MLLTIPLSFAQVPGSSVYSGMQPEGLAKLSAWFVALDGFLADRTLADSTLADSTLADKPEAGYRSWIKWSPAAKLTSKPEPTELQDTPIISTAEPELVFKETARQALDELAMISFGSSSRDDGLVHVSKLPVFVSAAAALLEYQAVDAFTDIAKLHDGANPLRVLLAFLSSLNSRDREAFRILAGLEVGTFVRILDFSGSVQFRHSMPRPDTGLSGVNRQLAAVAKPADLMEAERLLVSWRSSRLHAAKFQQGSLSHTAARAEAGKHLAALLDTDYGRLLFNPGWVGERFAQDAKLDLDSAWSAIGRAVATDLRREAVPWLARRLGSSGTPSFSLEYSVRPSPSNAYLALMTMRAVVNGVSYSIPYQVAARALSSASAVHFDDAAAPLRYIEEPLPGLRIYVSLDAADNSRAIAELEADLSAAYPAALRVPSSLLQLPVQTKSSFEESSIALDGAYREAAIGAVLAHSFSALLHGRSYPELAALILRKNSSNMENEAGVYGYDGITEDNEKSGVD